MACHAFSSVKMQLALHAVYRVETSFRSLAVMQQTVLHSSANCCNRAKAITLNLHSSKPMIKQKTNLAFHLSSSPVSHAQLAAAWQ